MAIEFLRTDMGQNVGATTNLTSINLSKEEKEIYTKRFHVLDQEKKGYISINDLRRGLQRHGEKVPGDVLHDIIREIDSNRNGQVELEEYLAMMSAIKSGTVVNSRFAKMAEIEEERTKPDHRPVTVERSGGGL